MQSTIDEARQRIIDADERGEKAQFADVLLLLKDDPIVSQCACIALETIIQTVENRPHPKELERFDSGTVTPDSARSAVLRALDSGQELGPALGQWMSIDRAASALFRFTWETITAPDDILHLAPLGMVQAA